MRDYSKIAAQLEQERVAGIADRARRMQVVVDALWDALHRTGVSWIGFYLDADGRAARGERDAELILGPRRDQPACSPIGLHGACGQCFLSGRSLVVRDVRALGPNYIACDPRDQSEVVVPCLDADGHCWGVLDLDSHDSGSFDDFDAAGLTLVLAAAGLTRM